MNDNVLDLNVLQDFGQTNIEELPVSLIKTVSKHSRAIKETVTKAIPFATMFNSLRSKARVMPILATGYKKSIEQVRIIPTVTSKDLQVFSKYHASFQSPYGHARGQGNFIDFALTSGKYTLEKLVFELVSLKLTAQASPKVVLTRVKNHFSHLRDFHSTEVYHGENDTLHIRPIKKG
jgi:hypothetical protein